MLGEEHQPKLARSQVLALQDRDLRQPRPVSSTTHQDSIKRNTNSLIGSTRVKQGKVPTCRMVFARSRSRSCAQSLSSHISLHEHIHVDVHSRGIWGVESGREATDVVPITHPIQRSFVVASAPILLWTVFLFSFSLGKTNSRAPPPLHAAVQKRHAFATLQLLVSSLSFLSLAAAPKRSASTSLYNSSSWRLRVAASVDNSSPWRFSSLLFTMSL